MSKKSGYPLRGILCGFFWAFLILFVPLLPGAPSSASSTSQEEFTVIARTQEKTKGRIFLVGDVEISTKDLKLFADRAELNTETKDCLATGNVTIQFPRESVSAVEVFINLDTKQGAIVKGDGMIQPMVFYKAESIVKKSQTTYNLRKAQITSCAQPVPRWKFSASRANIKKDDYIEMWNAVFRIKGIPVFYLPYMRFPINKDRATGFLMPQIGSSKQKGFNYEQTFYWNIARNMDATFNFDYYAARGLGGGLQFRYLFNQGTGGELNLYGFRFKPDAAGVRPEDAYILRFNHNQPLPLGFKLVADVDIQSSIEFLREFDNNFQRAIVANRKSQVYLQRSWAYFNLSARFSRLETFFGEGLKNEIISKSLPEVSFSMFKTKLFSSLYFSFDSSYSRTEFGGADAYEKGTQRKMGNISFSPTLSVPFTSIPWLTVDTAVTGNFVYYPRSFLPGTEKQGGGPLFTKNAVIAIDLVGPMVQKVYMNKQRDPVLKHSIEPYVSYYYESLISQASQIITATGRFFRNHYLKYGITNRFYTKKKDMPREVLQIGVGQTFYLSPDDGPLSQPLFWVNGKPPQFSEIEGSLRWYPAGNYSLDIAANYNPYYYMLSSLRLGANFGSPTDAFFMSVNWYKSTNAWVTDPISRAVGNRQEISGRAGIRIPKLSVEMTGDIDYNIQMRKLLYMAAAATYHYQCLDFIFEIKVFYFRDKPETQFKFSFGLGSIGKTTDFLGGHEY